jgi:signal transduction histidine kinase
MVFMLSLWSAKNTIGTPCGVRGRSIFGRFDVQLKIGDDGSGFDPAAVSGGDFGHFGLPGFKGRGNKIGGTVVVTSQPAAGTRIVVRVPLAC